MKLPIQDIAVLREIDQPDKALLLIVDDQTSNIAVLYEIFKADYEVCMATTGEDAVRLCQGRRPDLLLLDVVMPGMGGFELCRRLKQDPVTCDVPIIFVTSQDDPAEEARGLEEGGVDFITKPFHATVVRARVRTHIAMQRQAEQLRVQRLELEQSHAQLNTINDSSPLGLFHMTVNAVCTYVNRTYELITQQADGRALGNGWMDAVLPDDLPTLTSGWALATKNAARYEGTHRLCRANGAIRYVQMTAVPVMIGTSISGYVGTIDDITERLTVAAAVDASEKRLRLITDAVPAIIGYVDHEERYRFCNRQYEQVLGFKPAQMIGATLREVYGEEAYVTIREHAREVLTGKRISFERTNMHAGKIVHLQCDYVPDIADDGKTIGFYALLTDITAHRMMQSHLVENEKRLRTITDNLPALITYIDCDHRFQFANATMQKWTGKSMEDINGKLFDDVMGGALYDERHQHLTNALAGNRVEFEMTADAFGHVRHLHSTYVPDFGENREVRGIYTLTHDISKLKTIEQELRKLARFDSLTKLPNRAHLYELLDAALARARRHRKSIAVCFLDIDHFKSINDSMGHASGDLVLCEIAARLESAVRATDAVARLSGDEFIIILEDLGSANEAELVAQKILEATRSALQVGAEQIFVTTSIGIVFDALLEQTGPALIAAADGCLYEAKAAGRNTFRTKSS